MLSAAREVSDGTRSTAGLLFLSLLAVEWGGLAVMRITRGQRPATEFQKSFAPAEAPMSGLSRT
jgi:hypothetical protein